MTKSMTKLSRAARAFAATLAIVGVTAVLAGVQTARASDQQASEGSLDDAINRQAAERGYAVAPQSGPYASARGETASAPRKDFQDIK